MTNVEAYVLAAVVVVPLMAGALWFGYRTGLDRLDPDARRRLLEYEDIAALSKTDPAKAEARAREAERALEREYEKLKVGARADPAAAKRFLNHIEEQLAGLEGLERDLRRGPSRAPTERSLDDMATERRRLLQDAEWARRLSG